MVSIADENATGMEVSVACLTDTGRVCLQRVDEVLLLLTIRTSMACQEIWSTFFSKIARAIYGSALLPMGEEALTERETEVLRHIAGGNRNRDIAEQLFISEETVKVHIRHIMEKLGASDRTQAVAIGVRRGIIQL